MSVAAYRRREPSKGVLHRVITANLLTFIDLADARGAGLPKYVRNAFWKFLECGDLAKGFARVHCPKCGLDGVVAFSCKQRGLCTSCDARRMADTAAWLVDDVIPDVPVRQWVLSVPYRVRFALARDAKLLTKALTIFVAEVFRDVRRRTKAATGAGPEGKGKRRRSPPGTLLRQPSEAPGLGAKEGSAGPRREAGLALRSATRRREAGAVTGVQRFGGALNLNVHFHTILLDGVFEEDGFREAPEPSDDDVERVLLRSRRRIERMLVTAGVLADEEPAEAAEPMDLFQAASIQGLVAMSDEVKPVTVLGGDLSPTPERKPKRLCAQHKGYSVHAAVRMKAHDRKGREILCKYVLRPSYSAERMTLLPDGRIAYEFRREWEDGSSCIVLTPMELMEKLSALIPPPRYHLVRYHGVLAPRSKRRKEVLRKAEAAPGCGHQAEAVAPAVAAGPTEPEAVRSEVPELTVDGAGDERVAPARGLAAEPPPAREAESAVGTGAGRKAEPPANELSKPAGPRSGEPLNESAVQEESAAESPRPVAATVPAAKARAPASAPSNGKPSGRERRRRFAWAELMMRTMDLDVLECPRCGERMAVIACIDEPDVVEKFLRAVGLWEEPPPLAPSRAGPEEGEGPPSEDDGPEWDHLEE